jgi:ABC-2 type transport system permease protein
MFSTGSLFHLVLMIVVIFYLAGCLYDDRRDRSILFWKSLPVSDTLTVASKLLTATIAAPLMYLAVIALTQVVLLLIASGYGLAAGINIFSEIWAPANLPQIWLVTLYAAAVQSLWLLPIFGWLMLCSSFAPRLPILIAIIVPALIGLFQHFWSFFTDFRMPEFNLMLIVLQRLGRGVVPMSVELEQIEGGDMSTFGAESLISFKSVNGILFSLEMWIGVAIGLAFLAGAVWFRKRATDA